MKILLLNQTFYPDVVSSAQHLTDLARSLRASGHEVTVIAADRGYDDQKRRFPRKEIWQGIRVLRVPSSRLGKGARWRRAVDIATFLASCTILTACLGRFDVIVAMTSPPLVAFIGATFARVRRSRFVSWVMDLNPDEAIAAGWLKPDSVPARLLDTILRFTLRGSDRIIVLDRFMRDVIQRKAIAPTKIAVIPPWSHDDLATFDLRGRDAFREEHNLNGKFVVMYAGNHSPCNPLDTLISAADLLRAHPDVVFCFVGGGSEFRRLQSIAAEKGLPNVRFVPYQPRDRVAAMLSSADLHIVVMGNPFVGVIHPCKVYNVLQIDSPLLYIGPADSHIADLLATGADMPPVWTARHGDADSVAYAIVEATRTPHERRHIGARDFSQEMLLPRMVASIADVAAPSRRALNHITT